MIMGYDCIKEMHEKPKIGQLTTLNYANYTNLLVIE